LIERTFERLLDFNKILACWVNHLSSFEDVSKI